MGIPAQYISLFFFMFFCISIMERIFHVLVFFIIVKHSIQLEVKSKLKQIRCLTARSIKIVFPNILCLEKLMLEELKNSKIKSCDISKQKRRLKTDKFLSTPFSVFVRYFSLAVITRKLPLSACLLR